MKEIEISATKAHHESMHIMRTNAIYVNKTEIYGYLSVLGYDKNFQQTHCNGEPSLVMNEIEEIALPLYKDSNGKQTKCDKV